MFECVESVTEGVEIDARLVTARDISEVQKEKAERMLVDKSNYTKLRTFITITNIPGTMSGPRR